LFNLKKDGVLHTQVPYPDPRESTGTDYYITSCPKWASYCAKICCYEIVPNYIAPVVNIYTKEFALLLLVVRNSVEDQYSFLADSDPSSKLIRLSLSKYHQNIITVAFNYSHFSIGMHRISVRIIRLFNIRYGDNPAF
jgi:hypothetical protein